MKFSPVFLDDVIIGYQLVLKKHLVFFGTAAGSEEAIKQFFGHLDFFFVKQTHSDKIIKRSSRPVEADAHFTTGLNEALAIKTADCLPVMIIGESLAIAVHAGWRGLVAGILPKAISAVSADQTSMSPLKAFIGPHIGSDSFEVGRIVGRKIEASFLKYGADEGSALFSHPTDSEKCFANLSALAHRHLNASGIPGEEIFDFQHDTLKSPDFHSYRRDSDRAGRQISFVARILD